MTDEVEKPTNAHEAAAVARRRQLERDWRAVNDKINDLYWIFTRSARGTPPAVVAPELYGQRNEIERELRALRRAPPVSPTLTARWWRKPEHRHLSRAEHFAMEQRPHFNLSEVPRGDHPDIDEHVAWWIEHGLCRETVKPIFFETRVPTSEEVSIDLRLGAALGLFCKGRLV